MTIHYFVCDDCNITTEDSNTRGIHVCPKCDNDMRWDLKGIAIHGNYKHPIHSDALAILPSQVSEHRKKFPNIELDSQCRPILNNYVSHRNYLNAIGFRKEIQKIKPKSTKIKMGK